MVRVAVVYHSAYGHTEVLARAVLYGIAHVENVEGVFGAVERF